ncbi:MAG: hypothetical protein J6K81_04555 [Rikenellaceae bacterium]|nr:hypothetical protein [Rikenellaceae bacterium]
MKHYTFRILTLASAMVLLGGLTNINAQTRGEVTGIATGQIRKVEKPVTATKSADYDINAKRGEQSAEWVRVAEHTKRFTPRFQYGVKGGINGLVLNNSAAMNEKGVGNRQYSVNNSCKYYYEDTPRSERQNRVSWNISAFGRFNFGQGNLQAEINFNENRYETVLINQTWSPDKRIMTGTIYDRSIDIPVLIGWKYSIFRLYVGPQFRVWTKYNTANEGTFEYKDPSMDGQIIKLETNVKNVGFDPNKPDQEFDKFGLQRVEIDHSVVHFAMGMSFEFSNVVIDARYVTPFKRPVQNFYSFNNNIPISYKLSYHTIQVGVGVIF